MIFLNSYTSIFKSQTQSGAPGLFPFSSRRDEDTSVYHLGTQKEAAIPQFGHRVEKCFLTKIAIDICFYVDMKSIQASFCCPGQQNNLLMSAVFQ